METQSKKEKLFSSVRITTNNGIKMQDTRSKDPNINCGEFYVDFKFTSKEDYLNWVALYKEIVNSDTYESCELGVYRELVKDAPINLKIYRSAQYLLYKIREASKIHAENCYQASKKQMQEVN